MKKHSRHLIWLIKKYLDSPPPLTLTGIEVGVWEGANSAALLKTFPSLRLWMVDYYCNPDKFDLRMSRKTESEFVAAHLTALESTRFASDRRFFRGQPSIVAAKLAYNEYFDFVFIDAAHNFENVQADIQAWFPKIRKGGLVSGHDYGGRHEGVKQAVDLFAGQNNYTVNVMNGTHIWWFLK